MLRRLLAVRRPLRLTTTTVRKLATDRQIKSAFIDRQISRSKPAISLRKFGWNEYEVKTNDDDKPLWRIPASFIERYKTATDLPISLHPRGYNDDEVKTIIGVQLWSDFEFFMANQTVAVHPTTKTALYYRLDVMDFIRRKRGEPKPYFRMQ
jgi:hypothetical protein